MRADLLVGFVVLCGGVAFAVEKPAFRQPTDVWAGIPSHPAVINHVSVEKFGRGANNISLAGEWDVVKFAHGSGVRTVRPEKDLWAKDAKKVTVPGCWEAQGIGEPGLSTKHLCQDASPKKLRHTYIGECWYRRYADIPADWSGKRIWIKIGGVLAQGWIFVNDHPVALVDTGSGTWKWEITDFVKPGERTKIVVNADNTVGHRGGPPGSVERWGGIWRDIELEATAETFVDDVWIRGDFDHHMAEVKVKVEGERRTDSYSLRVTIDDETKESPLRSSPSPLTFTLEVPLRDFRPWSPEHPNLYWAKIELVKDGKVVDVRHERFGVRKLEVRGKELYLNNRPFYVRGMGDNPVYPLTGITPADRDFHRTRLAKARKAGFNYIRHHTHTEAPEYMEACDELGFIVMPEIPYYLDNPNDYFSYDPIRDADTLVRNFRRHPSFGVLSFGNEGMLGPGANRIVYDYVKALDPDILVVAQDGGAYLCNHGVGCSDFCSGPLTTWARGTFNPRAFVCHEYMNLAAKFDWRDEKDYTGLWFPPMTAADRRAHLAHTGLSMAWLERLQDAGHALQSYWQKYGIEIARADPYCDGFIFWTIADSTVFNKKAGTFTGQGVFDPFWRTKRHGTTPEAMAVYNSPTCILLDTETAPRVYRENTDPLLCCGTDASAKEGTNRVFAVGETIPVEFILSHYGEEPIVGGKLSWAFVTKDGTRLAGGDIGIGDQPIGPARSVAKFTVPAPDVAKPTRADLVVRVGDATNSWPFWFFPRTRALQLPETVVLADWGSAAAEQAIKDGKNLITIDHQTGAANFEMGWWNIGAQVGTAILPHPVLGDFPYEPYLSPLLFRIIKEGAKLPVEGFSEDDFVIVGEGLKDAYLYLAVRDLPNGRKHVFVSGLDITSGSPEGRWLMNEIVKWTAGRGKNPVRVVAFGDSITKSSIGISPEQNWLRLLQERMGEDYRMINAGVNGNSAREAMARYERDVLSHKPDVVLIEFGGNNADPFRPERRVDDAEFRMHLRTFRDGLPKACKVVAITFPRVSEGLHRKYLGVAPDAPKEVYSGNAGLESQRQILREFARENGWKLVDLFKIMESHKENLVLDDGVHLNPKGQKAFADAVYDVLNQ